MNDQQAMVEVGQQDVNAQPPMVSGSVEPPAQEPRKPRGFAALPPELRRALGSKGGRTAHASGTAYKFTSETASAAGKIPHERGTAYRWTSEDARRAGQKGKGVPRARRPRP